MSQQLKLAICKNQLVALTYGRIANDELKDGLYKYDIQSTDDGFEPFAIKEHVLVNHWGTLVSRVPLPVDDSGWLILEESDFVELNRMILTQDDYAQLPEETIKAFLNKEDYTYDNHQVSF